MKDVCCDSLCVCVCDFEKRKKCVRNLSYNKNRNNMKRFLFLTQLFLKEFSSLNMANTTNNHFHFTNSPQNIFI